MEDSDSWVPPTAEGEPKPETVHESATARAWADAYARLLKFERGVLGHMQSLRNQAPERMQPMIDSSNIEPMRELIEVFARRQSAWEDRANEIGRAQSAGRSQSGDPS
jgi:hypothetical protein